MKKELKELNDLITRTGFENPKVIKKAKQLEKLSKKRLKEDNK